MKKLIVLAAIAAVSFTSVHAQEVRFGIKGGVNFASLNGDDADDLDGKTSIHLGGVVNIPISELFAVQPEVIYSRQGFENSEPELFDVTVYLDYLNIPIMADFTVAEGLSLQGGPQVGININSISKDNNTDNETDIDDVETLDLGVGIGGQYKLPMGLFFQARYVIGLSDVFPDANAKNSVVSVSVGWFFN
ncbi:porin family protein [Altibacter sp.]|uniref:porin family protein n=1 Tax=Altibacter sp. TaxID=2024823 RepID=UPI000C990ABF|nr:porin family protein [Altibacter sp.]MAP54201.1 hypothetical protein [Altibacter sp.]|tara:strand:- start:529 stop:1101 length:573 start_codon:yes stop_codon:yes gene_type:complete